MDSRGSSPIGASEVSIPGASEERGVTYVEGTDRQDAGDSTDTPDHSVRSDGGHRRPRPTGAPPMSVTNDSFGQPLGSHTIFGATRPFSSHQGSSDVEQFLTETPVVNYTFVPSSVQQNTGVVAGPQQQGDAATFVSIPKADTLSAGSSLVPSPWPTSTVPPLVVPAPRQAAASSLTSTSSRKTAAPSPVPPAVHHDPHPALTATISSSQMSVPIVAAFTSSSPSAAAATPSFPPSRPPLTATQSGPLVASSSKAQSAASPVAVMRPQSASTKAPPSLFRATGPAEAHLPELSAASATMPHTPSRRTSSTPFPPPASVGSLAVSVSGARPASPSLGSAGRQGSSHSNHSHASEVVSPAGGAGSVDMSAHRPYSPVHRSPVGYSVSPTSRHHHHHYGGAAQFPSGLAPPPGTAGSSGSLSRTRSDAELRRLFSERGGSGHNLAATPATAAAGGHVQRGSSQSSVDRQSPFRVAPPTSVSSRQRGVVRASESSFYPVGASNSGRYSPSGGGGGGSSNSPGYGRPRWMNAVERTKDLRTSEDQAPFDPVLPYDQSKLGLQARRAATQGVLTAGKLRALEAQQAGGSVGCVERGYPQPLVAYSTAGGSVRQASYATRYSTPPSSGMPVLEAQEEALFTSTRHHGRAMSEQSGWRRGGHVRSVAGGRHGVTALPSSRVLVASEAVTSSSTTNNAPSGASFRTRAAGGGIPSCFGGAVAKVGLAEHKLANLFQGRSQPTTNNNSLYATDSLGLGGGAVGSSVSNGGAAGAARGAADDAKASAGGGADGGGGGGSGGGGGGQGCPPSSSGAPRKAVKVARGDVERNREYKSEDVKRKMDTEGDEDERDERNLRTRNINALHAIPWDQRRQLPMSGFGTRFFALLSTPRFWEKLDWTVRGSLLTVLPTMVLSLEPATSSQFPMPSSLAFNAFWITMPTFGSGLRELMIALKGFSVGLMFLCIIVGTHPGPVWVSLLLLFFFTLISSFVAEETKKTAAYVLASTIMQYITDPVGTNFYYVGQYYIGLLIALSFGTAAFLVPFIRWSSDIARHYIKAMGNSLSIDLQGTLSSFWVRSPLERELNVVRLRQLRATAEKCVGKIETALDEAGYEPHTGAYMMCMVNRFNFCKSIHNILGSLSHVIELIADNPSLIDTPMCAAFGEQISDHLAVISSAMDSMVLKIVDFERPVTQQEIQFFREARQRFQDALSRVREDVILTNENYETDESDVLLGFFMFSLDEMCEVISQFEETAHPPNPLWHALLFPIRDMKSVVAAFQNLAVTVVRRRTIPRRMKEAIKLSLCMVLPCIFQVYALSNNSISPMAGAAVIALIYNPTGSESFHYASGRLLGTVLGSMGALLSVQIANGRLWVLYIFIVLLSFIGAYVQAAPGFYALGNAIVCSTISICTQYKDQGAAMVRIQQNCFAILMYFTIACILWPMRGHTKVKMGLNVTLRCMREAITRMLRNLDMPYDANEVTADVSALLIEMNKKVRTQTRFIPGAVEEPTMGSAEYPEDAWKRIVEAEKKLCLALSMMCFAYNTFMSSRADSTTELSVHWVVLHRIAPHAQDLSDLIYASIDLYLLSLSKTTIVPTSHLTRLRVGMVDAHQAILDTYIATISRKVAGEQDTDEEDAEAGEDTYGDSSCMIEDRYGDHGDGADGGGRPGRPGTAVRGGEGNGGGDNTSAHPASPHQHPQRGDSKHSHDERHHRAGSPDSSGAHRDDDRDADGKARRRSKAVESGDGGGGGDKKKKIGYLGYDLTEEEAAALRAFVSNRVSNATFAGNKSMTATNATFGGRAGGGGGGGAAAAAAAVLAARAAGTSMAGSPPQANNDARLMSVTGGDDGLAAALRKKHKVVVRRGKDDENGDDDAADVHSDGSPAEEGKDKGRRANDGDAAPDFTLSNASFLKNNSFLRNTSFLGALFAKKAAKEPRDLDAAEMAPARRDRRSRQSSVSSSSAAARSPRRPTMTKRRSCRRGNEREGGSEGEEGDRSTPLTSPTRHVGPASVGSDFSDVEDEPKRGQKRSTSPEHRRTSDAAADSTRKGSLPPMARSTPVPNPLGDSGTAPSSALLPPMAQSSPMGTTRSVPSEIAVVLRRESSTGANATPAVGPPARQLGGAVAASTVSLFSGDDPALLGASLATSGGAGTTMLHHPPTAAAVDDGSRAATEANASTLPQPCSGAGEPVKMCGSHDSTHHSGDTEKKVVSGRDGEGTTHGSSEEKRLRDNGDDAPGRVGGRRADTGAQARSRGAAGKSRGAPADDEVTLNRSRSSYASHASSRQAHRPRYEGGGGGGGGGSGDGTSTSAGEGEILQNLSFYDAERGGFVLTNHDIHSLEAFLFGTRALVVYINELQKALLEMQHATEIATRL
ncbi:Fusaric acid resistance protein-like [Novymonas esmeraldas]|uniref:Fusaric acid resistance protein-like n=1 Tax=Novymonas esmeraldas TaxID=1808958 RepID=A0AAW0F6Q8_9TRYP